MSPCCGNSGCGCRIESGTGISITGTGTTHNPYVVSGDLTLAEGDTADFDVTIAGSGTSDDPYTIQVSYAESSRLWDIPDVDDTVPDDGDVLSYDADHAQWVAVPPTTAPVGSVVTDTSLTGDGSSLHPLGVIPDTTKGVDSRATGIGMSDSAIQQLIRRFASAATRTSAIPIAAVLNAFTVLDTNVGYLAVYDGTQWAAANAVGVDVQDSLLELSGSWDPTLPLKRIYKRVETDADASGDIVVLSDADLSGYSGVISCQYSSDRLSPVPYLSRVHFDGTQIKVRTFTLPDGDPVVEGTNVHGYVEAVLY